MKRLSIAFLTLCISGIAFSQTGTGVQAENGTIKLTNGQKFTVESTIDIEASLSMGGEMTSNSSTVNALEVKNSAATDYTISNTLTRLKLNTIMMGQSNNYDSENKEGNNAEFAGMLDDRLNKPVDIVIDNRTGLPVSEKKKAKKADADESSAAGDLMKMFSDNSDDAIVASAFQVIPAGKKTGDSWAATTAEKDMKIIRRYTLKSQTNDEAVVLLDAIASAVNKLNFMEMEFEIKTNTKTTGEIISDIKTGLVKKRTAVADISGTFQMMGQDMPISAKTNTVSVYK
ncbi:MAG: hypothetical protein IPL84_11435 [Chitinophagaceae bacterium]|nr:hypothetical protein [Chitinophagaceae bacterium]